VLEELIQKYQALVDEAEGDVSWWDATDWAQQYVYEDILTELKELQLHGDSTDAG